MLIPHGDGTIEPFMDLHLGSSNMILDILKRGKREEVFRNLQKD